MRDAVRFWFRGGERTATGFPPTLTVLHWLREHEHLTGTKEGCNQGDCGACTVVLAERDGDAVRLTTANSCLLPLAMLDGRALFTVEDVGVDGLHPVQQAMVDTAGSQCGFCTPGFVMSMWHSAEQSIIDGIPRTRDDLANDLTGNLCRCTGYRPILDAAERAVAQVVAHGPRLIDLPSLSLALKAVDQPGTLALSGPTGSYLAPDTEGELASLLAGRPDARIISGGTDLVLSLRTAGEDLRDDLALVATHRIPSLRGTSTEADVLTIGAGTSLEDAWCALESRLPTLARMHHRFAGPAIRSVGTIGGNIANGSPVADLVPVLIALDAALELVAATGVRTIPVAEFPTGVRRSVLRPGEFIARIRIPVTSFDRDVRSHKVARRFDDDISTVSATFAVTRAAGRIDDARVVLGGMATTVRRARAVESALRGSSVDDLALARALTALRDDVAPISDHRASAEYRMRAAEGLVRRWWREMTGADEVADVWTYR